MTPVFMRFVNTYVLKVLIGVGRHSILRSKYRQDADNGIATTKNDLTSVFRIGGKMSMIYKPGLREIMCLICLTQVISTKTWTTHL